MIEIKAYQCEHGCGKYLKTKEAMKRHELQCFYNIKNKACATCSHNVEYIDEDPEDVWGSRWCEAFGFDLFYGDKQKGERMRKNCHKHKSKGIR